MTTFEHRDVRKLRLPVTEHDYSPESIILEFDRGLSLDIGSLCFLNRSAARRKTGQGKLVDVSTFSETRSRQIRELIANISGVYTGSGRRPKALYTRYYHWFNFMNWCDLNGHSGGLEGISGARASIQAWLADSRRQVDHHILNLNTAAARQMAIICVLESFHACEEIAFGLNLFSEDPFLKNATSVPGEEWQGRVLAWCECLIDGLGHLILDTQEGTPIPFPFPLRVPAYLTKRDDRLWVFPLSQWCAGGGENSKKNRAYDYDQGRVFTVEELSRSWPVPARKIRSAIRSAEATLVQANADPFCRQRILRGFLVQSSFFVMLLAVTGLNGVNAAELPWSEELEENVRRPEATHQGFRTIKYRAGGRLVSFEIGIKFMPYLRRFLEVRNYLLMGERCEHLFFNHGGKARGAPIAVRADPLANSFYRSIAGVAEGLPKLKSRKWRAAKQDHMIRHEEPAVSATLLQHSLQTTLTSYSNGSEVCQQKELSSFFGSVEKVVLSKGSLISDGEVRSVGKCRAPSQPTPVIEKPPVQPDCEQSEGCLFCEHFRVHADEIDIRKLFSARHCIRVSARYSPSPTEYDKVFGPVLNRIEAVLDEIRRRDRDIATRIETEVDTLGELDSFWSAKLATLVELGMELL